MVCVILTLGSVGLWFLPQQASPKEMAISCGEVMASSEPQLM